MRSTRGKWNIVYIVWNQYKDNTVYGIMLLLGSGGSAAMCHGFVDVCMSSCSGGVYYFLYRWSCVHVVRCYAQS